MRLEFEGSMGLRKYGVTPASALSAHFRLHGGEMSDLVELAGYSYPLTGLLEGTLQVGGTWQTPRGQGVVQISNPAYAGSSFNVLRADLRFTGERFELENVFLAQGKARVTGVAGYDFDAAQFHFDLQGGKDRKSVV